MQYTMPMMRLEIHSGYSEHPCPSKESSLTACLYGSSSFQMSSRLVLNISDLLFLDSRPYSRRSPMLGLNSKQIHLHILVLFVGDGPFRPLCCSQLHDNNFHPGENAPAKYGRHAKRQSCKKKNHQINE